MKKLTFILACTFLLTTVLVSCIKEGPMGPQGLPGVNGVNGVDANANCTQCHNESTTLKAKMIQFSESAHALGTYYTRGEQCAACHSNEGFRARVDYTSIEQIDDFVAYENTPISCYTCHSIHQNGDASDYALTFTAQITETILGYSSPEIDSESLGDYGNGNLCLQCHQARDRGNVPSITSTDSVALSSYWGPHYGAQGQVFYGTGGVNIAGTLGYPTPGSGHGAIDNACITCHMHEGDHRMTVNYDACVTCHTSGDAEDKVAELKTNIEDKLNTLATGLETAGALVYNGTDLVYEPANATVSADLARLVWNYMLVKEDQSFGTHNPIYVNALLVNSIADLPKKK